MGVLDRFERKLEAAVGAAFARVFGGNVVPQEVEQALQRAAADGVKRLDGGYLLAPNSFTVVFGESDHDRLTQDEVLTSRAFARHLAQFIHESGWQTYGPVTVHLERSETLHTGEFRTLSTVNPDADPSGGPAPAGGGQPRGGQPPAGGPPPPGGQPPRSNQPWGPPQPGGTPQSQGPNPPRGADPMSPQRHSGYAPPPAGSRGSEAGHPQYFDPDNGEAVYGGRQGGAGQGPAGYGGPGYGQGGYGAAPQGGRPQGGAPYGGQGYGGGRTLTASLELGDGSGRNYTLREGNNVLGRGQEAQFRVPDTGVSRRHAEIRWDGQLALLADLESTNGTTVNGSPVTVWQLADGDVIRIGHSEIMVRIR